MVDIILIVVLLLIVAGAGFYIYRAKKHGQACIGCPHAKACISHSCSYRCEKNAEKESK